MMLPRRNVLRVVEQMREQNWMLEFLVRDGRIAIVGAMYDIMIDHGYDKDRLVGSLIAP
jgi:carbonic anhydrase